MLELLRGRLDRGGWRLRLRSRLQSGGTIRDDEWGGQFGKSGLKRGLPITYNTSQHNGSSLATPASRKAPEIGKNEKGVNRLFEPRPALSVVEGHLGSERLAAP